MKRTTRMLAILVLFFGCLISWVLLPADLKEIVTSPQVLFFLGAISIIPLVLLIEHWRKIINPIIETVHNVLTYQQRRKYFPPKISIEGHGAKRGLTLVEAAIVLEKSFDAILTLLLAETIEKGALKVEFIPEITVSVEKLLPKSLSVVERWFARACDEKNQDARRDELIDCMVKAIKLVNGKMKGFDLTETIRVYRSNVDDKVAKFEASKLPLVAKELIGDLENFTLKVTEKTNPLPAAPIFKELPEYMKIKSKGGSTYIRRSGGGHGGCASCACACAGCACAGCACACAGGGR